MVVNGVLRLGGGQVKDFWAVAPEVFARSPKMWRPKKKDRTPTGPAFFVLSFAVRIFCPFGANHLGLVILLSIDTFIAA